MTDAAPIRLVDPDPRWPQVFQQERLRIAVVLGKLAASFEHVGSTAIATVMRTRPVIDLLVGLRPGAVEADALAKIGKVPATHRVIVCEYDGEEWRRLVMFRDWLSLQEPDARAYTALKVQLSERHPHDLEAYTAGKTDFVREICEKASKFPARRLVRLG